MLKILLGGIAGVVTGYALKKYLDEEECYCPHHEEEESVSDDTDNSDTAHINPLDPLDTTKGEGN